MPHLGFTLTSPRIRGRKSFFLVKSDYDAMLAAETAQAALRRLEGTRYQTMIAPLLVEEFNPTRVEGVLMKTLERDVKLVIESLRKGSFTGDAIALFQALHRSFELRPVATAIKSILLGTPWEQASTHLYPYGEVDVDKCRALIEAKDIKEALPLLGDNELIAAVEGDLKVEAEKPELQALAVEATIERFRVMRVWEKAVAALKGKRNAARLIGIPSDMVVATSLFRLKKLGFTPNEIDAHLPAFRYQIPNEDLKRAELATTEKDSIKLLAATPYVDMIAPLIGAYEVREDLSIFEVAFKRYHAEECRKVFPKGLFQITEPLAYIYLRFYEVTDLIALLLGKHLGLPSEKIEAMLTLHQPLHPI